MQRNSETKESLRTADLAHADLSNLISYLFCPQDSVARLTFFLLLKYNKRTLISVPIPLA